MNDKFGSGCLDPGLYGLRVGHITGGMIKERELAAGKDLRQIPAQHAACPGNDDALDHSSSAAQALLKPAKVSSRR